MNLFANIVIGGYSVPTALVLSLISLVLLGWGFERYRSRFNKSDLYVPIAFSVALWGIAAIPGARTVLRTASEFWLTSVLFITAVVTLLLIIIFILYARLSTIQSNFTQLIRNLTVEQAPDDYYETSNQARADGGSSTICIVIPAYNEAETIQTVLHSLPDSIRGYEVEPVVVSDGSVDNTADRADTTSSVAVEHPLNQGQGGALKTGFEIARQGGASIVVTMDADGQHPADELEKLVSPIIDDEADYVMGSRYKGENLTGNGFTRETGIRAFTHLINVLTKSEITDCTNGYRAIRGSSLQKLTLTEERFSAPELIIEARKNGLRLQEIPITIREREAGETKKPKLGYAVGLSRTIFVTWIR